MKALTALLAFLTFVCAALCEPERFAVVVCAKSGEQTLLEENKRACERTLALLKKAGFPKDNVKLFAEWTPQGPSAEAVMECFEALKKRLPEDAQLWVFLYGEANVNQKGLSLATSGSRLRFARLAAELDAIKAKQFVFLLTRQSAGGFEALKSKPRLAVSACSSESETNPPRLPKFLLDEFERHPENSVQESLKNAFEALERNCAESGVAVAETPALFDGESATSAPFGDKKPGGLAALPFASSEPSLARLDPRAPEDRSQAKRDKKPGALEFNAPTAETLALIEEARKAAKKHEGFSSFALYENRSESFTDSLARKGSESSALFLLDESAAASMANVSFIDAPPREETEVELARIVRPDGSWLDVEPERSPFDLKLGRRITTLKFPGAAAGCALLLKLNSSAIGNASLPFASERFELSSGRPVEKAVVSISAPLQMKLKFKVRNASARVEEKEEPYAKTAVFTFENVPAFEPLPGDPPPQECLPCVEASSLQSWKDFSAWAVRMTANNDAIDERTKELVERLVAGCKTDAEKLKALYEFLCELRYETTPVGARTLRPRSSGEVCVERYGDCKDKANALVVMARAAGVEGHMALVGRGLSMDPAFPSWQFNHALAFFPKLDGFPQGLWLDATDGSTPFGLLPPGDIGRAALLLDGESSAFKTVAPAGSRKSRLLCKIVFSKGQSPDGELSGRVELEADGMQDYLLRQKFKLLSPLQAQFALGRLLKSLSGCELACGKPKISPLHELSSPFKLEASVKGFWSGRPPLAPEELLTGVSLETRARPLVLFHEQPFESVVSLEIEGSGAKPETFSAQGPGIAWEAKSAPGFQLLKTEVSTPRVEASAYPKFREAVLKLDEFVETGKLK